MFRVHKSFLPATEGVVPEFDAPVRFAPSMLSTLRHTGGKRKERESGAAADEDHGDGDGYGTGDTTGPASCDPPAANLVSEYLPEDCEDGDDSIYPTALEICEDEIDQDCDGND